MVFSRGSLIRSPWGSRPGSIPSLTERQAAALDALHFTAMSSACILRYKKGDIVFFNNRRVLHGRQEFQDDEASQRHMLRLWLRDEELAEPVPGCLDRLWKQVFSENETGVEEDAWPLVPLSV